jgi:hypothetical protein
MVEISWTQLHLSLSLSLSPHPSVAQEPNSSQGCCGGEFLIFVSLYRKLLTYYVPPCYKAFFPTFSHSLFFDSPTYWCHLASVTTDSLIKYSERKHSTSDRLLLLSGIYNPYAFESPSSGGSEITHKDASQSAGLPWTSDQPVAETSTSWQHTLHPQRTTTHAPGGIRTCNPSKRSAADTRLRPLVYWDRHKRPYFWSFSSGLFQISGRTQTASYFYSCLQQSACKHYHSC